MKIYTVYFEVFGKKMKTKILAYNENQAKDLLIKKIIFHKVELSKDEPMNDFFDDMIKAFDDLIKSGKK